MLLWLADYLSQFYSAFSVVQLSHLARHFVGD